MGQSTIPQILSLYFPFVCLLISGAGVITLTFAKNSRVKGVGSVVAILFVLIFNAMFIAGSLVGAKSPEWVQWLLEKPIVSSISIDPAGLRFSLVTLAVSAWLLLALFGLYLRSCAMLFASIYWSYYALLALVYTVAGLFGGQLLTAAGSVVVIALYIHLNYRGGK